MPKTIPLTRGFTTLIDDADYDWLSQWRWLVVGPGYAGRFEKVGGGRRLLYMHRIIIDAQPGQRVDHINRDRLDNRRENLRIASPAQNQQNRSVPSSSTSGYKGVSWHSYHGLWHARLGVNGTRIHLGYFRDLETAARVYDAAARWFHRDFAFLNFPDDPTTPQAAGLFAHVMARRAAAPGKSACGGQCALCPRCREQE